MNHARKIPPCRRCATASTKHGNGCGRTLKGEVEYHYFSLTPADLSLPLLRPLRIRHLKTAYGDFVDLEERVVGDLFDDRGADGNIRNSILEVHRYPPTPDELERVQRFSSFAPTSSARPRKRPLELPSQSYPSIDPRITYGEIRSIEEGDAETNGPFVPTSKRQCMRDSRLNRAFDPHQPLGTREEQGSRPYHSSQISGTQESIHQVPDSQKSPGKKRMFWVVASIYCPVDKSCRIKSIRYTIVPFYYRSARLCTWQ